MLGTPLTVEELAKELYDDCQTVKPEWHQLGDYTKSYWLELAAAGHPVYGYPPLNPEREHGNTQPNGRARSRR